MQITYATEAAPGHVNEDRAVCGDGWAVVLDGATAPDGVDSGCIHDVPWLVSNLAAGITRRMLLGGGHLADVLAESIEETREAHKGACDLANPDSPSSTACIARVRDGSLDYLVLGDSPMVIRSSEGITAISDDRIAGLPGGRPYTRELVRAMRNQPGGFWVASTDPDAAYQAEWGGRTLAADSEVGLFTDGISRLVEFYGYDWEQVFGVMEAVGPAGLISVVRSAEQGWPLCGYNKRHDDATAVLMGRPGVLTRAEVQTPADWRSLVGL